MTQPIASQKTSITLLSVLQLTDLIFYFNFNFTP